MSPSGTPWKTRREIPDAQVRDAADQFDDARRLLLSQPPGTGVLLPLLNNAAVALELYLKCLGAVLVYTPVSGSPGLSLVTAKPEAKKHKLVNLLDAMPGDVRADLEARYLAECPGRLLREDLACYEGLFETSRYVFEKTQPLDPYQLSGVMELCDFLRSYVSALTPMERIEW